MRASEFNLVYFRYIREEILRRVEIHYRIVIMKMTAVGAILAFMLKGNLSEALMPSSSAPFIVASIVAFLMDVLILENLGWLRSAGTYIRENIENGEDWLVNWERDFAQRNNQWACFSFWGYLIGVWSIGFVLSLMGVVVILWENNPKYQVEIPLLIIDAYLTMLSLGLAWRNLREGTPPMRSISRGSSPVIKDL